MSNESNVVELEGGLSIIALTGGRGGEEFTTKNELMIRLRG